MLLSIDPGIDTAWAQWKDGRLWACKLSGNFDLTWVSSAIIECPQVYPGTPQKQANDLITLAVMVGRYQEQFLARKIPVTLILPHKWKGTIPKDVHNNRVLSRLDPKERELYQTSVLGVPSSKRHNVVDAIGLGLYALKRLVPGQG